MDQPLAHLSVEGLHTYYGRTQVLYGVSFDVAHGATIALLGRNGMGKTTTIRSIMGLTPPRHGHVVYEGRDITGLRPDRAAAHGLGLVAQGRRIFPSLTVEENLLVAARVDSTTASWTLDRVYELFPFLRERRAQPGALLSGGQQQMLAISRALLTNPQMLILDEPSEGLAPTIVNQVRDVIRTDLRDEGMSILLVEQNVRMALEVADSVVVISKGSVVFRGAPEDLGRSPDLLKKHLGVST